MNINNKTVGYIRIGSKQVQRIRMLGSTVYELPAGQTLEIVGPSSASGETVQLSALYNGASFDITQAVWAIATGSASITGGLLIIPVGATASALTVSCTYHGITAFHNITVTYESGASSETTTETVTDPDTGETTTIVETVTENPDGSTETETQTTVTDENGDPVSTTTQTTTEYDDGSSETTATTTYPDGTSTESETAVSAPDPQTGSVTTETTTTNYDENGDATGSSGNTTVNNTDGSSTSTTTNYNADGDPTDQTNQETDTEGNSSTQEIEYNDNGEPIVTGYEIDTSGSASGEKNFDETGVNTEFYGFDVTRGFILNMHFTIDFSNQPADQDENHHQILTMKRATPEPWYGFQLRQSGTNKYIQLGTQFDLGGNTNTKINPHYISGSNTISEYNFQITYDPTAIDNNFVCVDLMNNATVLSTSNLFPDLPELEYLTVCIGYGLDSNGDPYRYSNINVLEFSIQKLPLYVAAPSISCDGQQVTITCDTVNARIMYRIGTTGSFVQYSNPIPILSDVTVYAYAVKDGSESVTVSQLCEYDDGIEEPVIYCDGEDVTITCDTPSSVIYYRIGSSGSFTEYLDAFSINSTVTVEAYSVLNGLQSETVSETCTYSPVTLYAPTVTCDGLQITLSCSTPGATIYYKTDSADPYVQYTAPITMTEDTDIWTYSSRKGSNSSVVTESCTYTGIHDYSQDYLTFQVLSSGTIVWKSLGSGYDRTIEYSINDGPWTSVTSTAAGASVSVSAGDSVRFRGTNTTYAGSKSNYSGFEGGTAAYDIEGNIHSLLYGDNFASNSALTNSTYQFCSIFKKSNAVSAENLILPATTLTKYCYRAMFSLASSLAVPPALPATTLAQGCYYYMFEAVAITTAPELPAEVLPTEAYLSMFTSCANMNFIKCLATNISATNCTQNWVKSVASSGTFVKDGSMSSWSTGVNGIPTSWVVQNDTPVARPTISYDGFDTVTITCDTPGATIYYKTNTLRGWLVYSGPITISADTTVDAYAEYAGNTSLTTTSVCEYVSSVPIEESNRDLKYWSYSGLSVETPYSVNRLDGHSSSYAKGTFNFETSFALRTAHPTYLWFQHADQSADIYIDNVKVETHWGGYNAFFSDISNYVHTGTNNLKVALCNTTRNELAPAAGDFNFNATLGNVRLLTSPCLPEMKYGYDGMHITSTVTASSATVYIKTSIPSGASAVCTITDASDNVVFTETKNTNGLEQTYTAAITNPHLWAGTPDPYMYTVTLEISKNGNLYHRFQRPYGLRFYSYAVGDTTVLQGGTPYTGFLLNGQPYLLRGVCMHDDLDGKANALNDSDYAQEFAIIQELGCNFIRLAHYPHPKEVYDWCDRLGIIVQTEVPCVNKLQSTMPSDYYTHLDTQYTEMVNQHFNHPCIMFWGLSNETSTDDKAFAKTKIEYYTTLIKALDTERLVGYVLSHSYNNPSGQYNDPAVDWFGSNIYVGWYIDKATNDPTAQLNTRVANTITRISKPLAFSEYGAGGTQHCHSENPQSTTTTGNYARHDIEYQMWLHEGHIAAIRNFPQLLFTAEWQLFDIAVSNRNEGYTICLDGENTSTSDALRRLNNKGLVERDHTTKKDTFYIYKAEWSSQPFVHICGKDYTKSANRVIKCYTNDGNSLSMTVNGSPADTAVVTDHIAEFAARTFSAGDIVTVTSTNASDTMEF